MLLRDARRRSRLLFFTAALAILPCARAAWADKPAAAPRPPAPAHHVPEAPEPPTIGLSRVTVDGATAKTLLKAQITNATGKMPASAIAELRKNTKAMVEGLDGAQVSELHYRNETVGLEVRADGVRYRMTWPTEGTVRFFRQDEEKAPYRLTLSPLDRGSLKTLGKREPEVRELRGPLVLRTVRDPKSELTGPGPDFTRGVRTVEGWGGRHRTLPPSFVKPGTAPSAEDLAPARPLTDGEKKRALEMMVSGAHAMSRTASAGTTRTLVKATSAKVLAAKADKNIAVAAKYVLDNYDQLPIDMTTVNKLHDIITAGIEERYNQPEKTKRLETFFRWSDSDAGRELADADPVAFAERLHYYFVSLDTLDGGNGRTGRLMVDLVLLRHGLAPARYAGREEYYSKASPEWGKSAQLAGGKLPDLDTRVSYFRECVAGGEAFVREPAAHLH